MTSLQLPVGRQGAKRQTQFEANPRGVLRQVMDDNPSATEEDIFQIFMDHRLVAPALKADKSGIVKTITAYWFTHNYRSLLDDRRSPVSRAAKAKAAEVKGREYQEQATSILTTRIAAFVWSKMIMPNGKTLAECTFRETAMFGKKFLALSHAGQPNEKVGTLSEEEIRTLVA